GIEKYRRAFGPDYGPVVGVEIFIRRSIPGLVGSFQYLSGAILHGEIVQHDEHIQFQVDPLYVCSRITVNLVQIGRGLWCARNGIEGVQYIGLAKEVCVDELMQRVEIYELIQRVVFAEIM